MPRQRDHGDPYDEYDARAYAHLVPSGSSGMETSSRKHEKRKKSKQKSHKRSKDKDRRKDRERKRDSAALNSAAVAVIGRTSIVDYEDVSSDSGSLSEVSSTHAAPSRMEQRSSRSRGEQSPASLLRSYQNERSHSNSPVIRESSPYRTDKSASRKSKKRQRSPEQPRHSETSKIKYAEPPRSYVEPPKAYAESKSLYRNHSPTGSKKRYRSRSPTSPFSRRRDGSRYVLYS